MSRRLAAAFVTAACLAGSLVPAEAADLVDADFPRTDCKTRITDLENDAAFAAGQNTDSADLKSIYVRLTATEFQAFLEMKDLKTASAMPLTDSGYGYTFTAKFGDKTLTLATQQRSSQAPYTTDGVGAPTTGYPKYDTGTGDANALPESTGKLYHAKKMVVFTVPRARLEQNLGGPLDAGEKFTVVKAQTNAWVGPNGRIADTLNGPGGEWVVGDDYCFGPPPAALSDLVAPAVQFSDTVNLTAKLVSEKAVALADKTVEFKVAGDPRTITGKTNAEGVVSAPYPATAIGAGTHAVTATFPGDATDGKATVAGSIKISAEPTAFGTLAVAKPSATRRYVTATLLDNDKKPVAGQTVAWYVNGKKVASTKTDSKGKTVYKSARPTQTVQAKYTGLSGKYLASSSKSVRV